MARIALIAGLAAAGALTGGLAWAGYLGFGIGGSALGAIMGGATLGASVGSVLSSVIFPPHQNAFPPMNDLQSMSAAYGQPIPWGYGSYRIAGQVIWAQTMQVHKNSQKSGGGKGGGPTSTVYTYTISAAISFGYGPGSITRIWADSKLIYDVTAKGPISVDTGVSMQNGTAYQVPFRPTIYSGSATQLPDPTIQSIEGIGNTSGYRDQIYIVLNNFPLADFGNRLPNFRAEVTSATTLSYIKDLLPGSQLSGVSGAASPFFPHIDPINRVAYIENQYGQVVQKIDIDALSGTPADPWAFDTVYVIGNQVIDTNGNIQYCVRNHTSQHTGTVPWMTGETQFTQISGIATWENEGPGPDIVPIVFEKSLAWSNDTISPGIIGLPGYIATVDSAGYFWTQASQGSGNSLLRFHPLTLLNNGSIPLKSFAEGGPDYFSSVTRVRSPATGKDYLYYTGTYNNQMWVIDADAVAVVNQGKWEFEGLVSTAVGGLAAPAIDPNSGLAYLIFTPSTGVTGVGAYDPRSGITLDILWTNTYSYTDWAGSTNDVGEALLFDPTDNTLLMLTSRGAAVKLSVVDGSIISYTSNVLASGGTYRNIQAKAYNCLVPSSGVIILWASTGTGFAYLRTSDLTVLQVVPYSSWLPALSGTQLTWMAYDSLSNAALVCASTSGYVNFTAHIYFDRQQAAGEDLQSVVEDVWARTGADPALLDASALAGIVVKGYPVTQTSTGKGLLGPLMSAYFFDLIESDNVLRAVLRGQAVTTIIPENDLGTLSDNYETNPTLVQENDLPLVMTVNYYDKSLDYQQGTQTFRRNKSVKKTRNRTNISLPLTLSADDAAGISAKMLQTAWAERNQWEFKLWKQNYLVIDPTDVVQFTYNGNVYQSRIGKTSVGANRIVEVTAVSEDPKQYVGTNASGTSIAFQSGSLLPVSPSALFILDIPFITDGDNNPTGNTGYYWLMGAFTTGTWPGGQLYLSADNNTFSPVDIDMSDVQFGSVPVATPAPPTLWAWDMQTVINVFMQNGTTLSSDTLLNVLNGANLFYLGGELCAFANATLQADGSYNLSTLLRGLRGTEGWCKLHQSSETLVVLGTQIREVEPTVVINTAQYFRGVTLGQPVTAGVSTPTTLVGNDLKPYAPAQFTGTVDGSSNINISWVRRTRIGGAWLDGTGTVPLSEETESYDLEIRDGNTAALAHDTVPTTPVLQQNITGAAPYVDTYVQPFTAYFSDGVQASYLGHDFGSLSAGTYYVTVHDVNRVGESSGSLLNYYADATTTKAKTLGYTFCGVIVIPSSGALVTGSEGGSPLVVRTIAGLTSPSYQYTAAQQTTDFGSHQSSVYARVYQNSASIGRGFPASNPTIGNGTAISGGSDATSILGVTITGTPVDGDVLQYNAGANEWQIVGPLLKRQNLSKTTASLANNGTEVGSFSLGCSAFALLQISVDRSARVELYSTAAFRDADGSRAYNTPPTVPQNGIIADFGLIAGGAEDWVCSPPMIGANVDSPSPADEVYYRITNLSSGSSTVTFTVTIVPLEVV